jgi:16S rRNA processing protein RimM
LRGDVIVVLVTNRTERLDPGNVFNNGALVVTRSSPHQHRWIVAFEGVDNIDAATALRDTVLYAPPIDDAAALWVHELVGATVTTPDGAVRGVVESVQANPASDLLVLDTGALVPLRFVVDAADGEVIVDPPDGLFED